MTVAVLLGASIIFLQRYLFPDASYAGIEGLITLGILGTMSMVIWYLLLRVCKVEEYLVVHRAAQKVIGIWK